MLKREINPETQEVTGRWLNSEVDQLRELAKEHSDAEIAELMHRSLVSVQTKRIKLGLKQGKITVRKGKPQAKKWTEVDYDIFQSMILEKSDAEIAAALGRTPEAIKSFKRNVGITRSLQESMTKEEFAVYFAKKKTILGKGLGQTMWSREEMDRFHRLVKTHRDEEIAVLMNRSLASVRGQRAAQGYNIANPKVKAWTEEEDQKLRNLVYSEKTNQEIAEILDRGLQGIEMERRKLGLEEKINYKWTARDNERLKSLVYLEKSDQEIAIILNRTAGAIRGQRAVLGLTEFSHYKWTEEQIADLKRLSPECSYAEIGRILGIPVTVVARKCGQLGLSSAFVSWEIRGPYSKREDKIIIKFSRYLTNPQLAKRLGRSMDSVAQRKIKLRKMGYNIGTARVITRRKDWLGPYT